MNVRRALSIAALILLATPAGLALAQKARTAAPAARTAPGAGPAVATVGTASIPRAELDARFQQAMADYKARSGQDIPKEMLPVARRQVLEGLIRARMMALEARRLGVLGSEAEAESILRQMPLFQTDGRFDAAKYQGIRAAQPVQFAGALQNMREQLGARRMAMDLENRYSPPEGETRANATRELTRVTLDQLPLPLRDFDGHYPEPREADVLDWYRTHPADYRREDRATLSIAFVSVPQLADSLAKVPAAVEAWTQQMRLRADTMLAAVRAGAKFDSLAGQFGFRGNIVVARDNFPGYWRGTPAQANFLFLPTNRGRVLPEPVAATEGWLVVRVDDVTPGHLAPFAEVSGSIRSLLRRDRRLHALDNERRALYAELRDSLSGPGWPIHYAAVDTSSVVVPEPGPADLDRWYRGHEADYARFDAKTGGIVTTPLEQVRDDVRARYLHEERAARARELAEQLLASWRAGKRDPALEKRFGAKTTPALVRGSLIDTGAVARALGDTIWKVPAPRGGDLFPYARGWVVWEALPRVDRVTPTYEQSQELLGARVAAQHDADDLVGARALFDADRDDFRKDRQVRFTRITVRPPDALKVPLTRGEVESWYRSHLDLYSAAEMVEVSHIFILPTDKSPAADKAAHDKALDILHRLQRGEDFTQLAQLYSDDPTSRDKGGDLGTIVRGQMMESFDKAAFSTPPGTLVPDVIKTEVGYHVIKVRSHLPQVVHPLSLVYGGVAADAATEKAGTIARVRGDSLFRAVRDPKRLVEVAQQMGATVEHIGIGENEVVNNAEALPFLTAVRATPPGKIVPGSYMMKGIGAQLAVVDSVTRGSLPTWEEAKAQALEKYRKGAGARALAAKRAELDSLLAGGGSFDSLGTYWGGLGHVAGLAPGQGLPFVGGGAELDSLLFGGASGGAPMPAGAVGGWVNLAEGSTRFRITARTPPDRATLAARVEQVRRTAMEEKLGAYFDGLRKRYPVRILDPAMRESPGFGTPAGR